ncbi:MAG TPA: zinc-ribbon domain-containing protein [Anaerolineales bacterium]|nr:zinc-ribbon domain-containing protein [Anaerolineales bacterium]
MSDTPNYCEHCGAPVVISGAKFCERCGQPLGQSTASAATIIGQPPPLSIPPAPPPPAAPVPPPPPAFAPPPAAYAPPPPYRPVRARPAAAPQKGGAKWPIILAIGCLGLLCLAAVAVGVYFLVM